MHVRHRLWQKPAIAIFLNSQSNLCNGGIPSIMGQWLRQNTTVSHTKSFHGNPHTEETAINLSQVEAPPICEGRLGAERFLFPTASYAA
jgi:hypothetical protein